MTDSGIHEGPVWWQPSAWPTWLRRAFFLTLPISGPLYVGAILLTIVLTLNLFTLLVTAIWLKEKLWDEHRGPRSARC